MFRELTKARHRLIPVLTGNRLRPCRHVCRVAVNPRTYGEQLVVSLNNNRLAG